MLGKHSLTNVLDSRLQNEKRLLVALKGQMQLGLYDANDVLDTYSVAVREAFKNPGRLKLLNFHHLTQEESFKNWESNSNSSLFLLHGRTALTKTDCSWLSPTIFDLIGRYRDQRSVVIFHLCHDRVFMEKDTPSSVVISSLIYQLLEANTTILDQSKYEELSRKFLDPRWRAGQSQFLFAVMGDLLNIFSEVYILLDRVDRIKGDADRFLDPLLGLMKRSKCKVKVFLVASSNFQRDPEGKITADLLESLEELGPKRFANMKLDQK